MEALKTYFCNALSDSFQVVADPAVHPSEVPHDRTALRDDEKEADGGGRETPRPK